MVSVPIIRLKLKIIRFFEGIFISIFVIISYLILFSLLDFFVRFAYSVRYFAFISFFVTLAVSLFYFAIHPLFKLISDDDIALLIQRKNKFLKDDVINAVQLSRDLAKDKIYGLSKDIIEEFVKRVANRIKKVNLSSVFDTSQLKKYLISGLCSTVILFTITYLPPYIGKTSLDRLFNPLTDVEISKDFLQKELPEIGDVKVKVYYPKYTNLEPEVIEEGGKAEVLKNSMVVISGTSNKPLSRAIFKFRQDRILENLTMQVKNGIYPEIKLKAVEDFEYWIELIDRGGNRNKENMLHSIKVIKDEVPKVVLIFPQQDLMIAPNAELKVIYESSDDFGVTSSNLVIEKDNKIYKSSLERNDNPAVHKISEYLWDIGKLGLNFGESITFYVEVVDNDLESGPNVGSSQKIKLQVPTLESFMKMTSPLEKDRLDNLLKESQDLYSKHADFLKNLEKFKELGKFDLDRLMGDLDMLYSYFRSLQKDLASLGQVISEDFVNKEDVKDLGLNEISKLLNEIKKSIEEGDFEKAEKLAKELSRKLSELLKTLAKVLNKSRNSRYNNMLGESKSFSGELDKLLKDEKEIYSESNKINKLDTESLLKEQEELLKKLSKMQKDILDFAKKFKEDVVNKNIKEILNVVILNQNEILPRMQEVSNEFLNLKIKNSIKYLEEIINFSNSGSILAKDYLGQLNNNLKDIDKKISETKKEDKTMENLLKEKSLRELKIKDGLSVEQSFENIKNKEAEILELLKKGSLRKVQISQKEKWPIMNKQKDVTGRTGKLKEKFENFSKMGIPINEMIDDSISAISSMKGVESNLDRSNLRGAISKEQESIYYLEKLKQSADELSNRLGEMGEGEGGGLFLVAPSKGVGSRGGGILGTLEGYVKIPSPKEYKPPKEFREDIMDALKEKFPQKYKELIEEYYKKLLR
ncbi:MAG: hypothetical protein ABH873_02380 [Candidatus Firestonebacteria bacterium]